MQVGCRCQAPAGRPSSSRRGALPTWSYAAASRQNRVDRSRFTLYSRAIADVPGDLVRHGAPASRGIGDHRELSCAGRPGHGPETATTPRRSWRVCSDTRQESTRYSPHSIHSPCYGLSDSCGILRNLATFLCAAALPIAVPLERRDTGPGGCATSHASMSRLARPPGIRRAACGPMG
jgi:hypothetical protein